MYFYDIIQGGHKNKDNRFIKSTKATAIFYHWKCHKKDIKKNFKNLQMFLEQRGLKKYEFLENIQGEYDFRPTFKFKMSFTSLLANFGGVGYFLLDSYFVPKRINLQYISEEPKEKIIDLLENIDDYLLNGDWRKFLEEGSKSNSPFTNLQNVD